MARNHPRSERLRSGTARRRPSRPAAGERDGDRAAQGRGGAAVSVPDYPLAFLDPSASGRVIEGRDLALLSQSFTQLLGLVDADGDALRRIRALAVCPGDAVARLLAAPGEPGDAGPAAGQEPRCGPNVERDHTGAYRATRYGYLCCVDDSVSVVSPLWLAPDAMEFHWFILDRRPRPVTIDMLQQWAADLEVSVSLDTDVVRDLVARTVEGRAEPGRFCVATGTPPVPASAERREILVDLQGRAGKVQADGSIDFRETGAVPVVKADQLIARRHAGAPGQPGRDLRGHVLGLDDAPASCLAAGDNVRARPVGDVYEYYSAIDGAVRLEDDTLSVSPCLTVVGDVNFDTGNLDFDGEIFVDGSVTQGFSVSARGAITIAGAVEPGSSVTSTSNVTIGKGIVGQKTRVRVGGTLRAQFVQEARVDVEGDVQLGAFTYQALINCGGRLVLSAGQGPRGGSVIGGRAWARAGVMATHIGAAAHPPTIVVSGIEAAQVQQLERAAKGLETSHEHILRILRLFGLSRIDASQIRNLIQASAGPHRKLLASRARQLGQLAKVYQGVVAQKTQLEAEITASASQATIRATHTAHPGADVRVGAHRRVLDREIRSACFRIVDDRLHER